MAILYILHSGQQVACHNVHMFPEFPPSCLLPAPELKAELQGLEVLTPYSTETGLHVLFNPPALCFSLVLFKV